MDIYLDVTKPTKLLNLPISNVWLTIRISSNSFCSIEWLQSFCKYSKWRIQTLSKGGDPFFCRLPCRLFFPLRFFFFYSKHPKHGGGGRTGPTPRSTSVFPWHLDRSESTRGNYVSQRDPTLSHKIEEERPEDSQSKMTPNPWISCSIQKEATRTVCVLLKLNTMN